LTPNVAATGLVVVSIGSIRQVNDHSVTSGTFTGTLSCTLTIGGVAVPYSRSLSLTIGLPPTPCSSPGRAGGCLTSGAATVDVPLDPTLGSVHVSGPERVDLGYDASLVNGGIIVVPGELGDTALLQCDAQDGCKEICDDCIDDNADGLVDRDDPQC